MTVRDIIAWLGLLGLPTIAAMVGWAIKQIVKLKKYNEAMRRANQMMLRRELNRDYHKYMKLGCITDDDFDEWCDTFEVYSILFTNGKMCKKDKDIRALPIVKSYNLAS